MELNLEIQKKLSSEWFLYLQSIICDEFDTKIYSEFKKKCDSYFWNSHRNEARGVGGLFFDYLRENNKHCLLDLSVIHI